MTLEEKAGSMFITMIAVDTDGDLVERPTPFDLMSVISPSNSTMVVAKMMNHFNVVFMHGATNMAKWQNKLQQVSERTRLGIPVTIASDPRHAFGLNIAAGLPVEEFSLRPKPLGLAATRDPALLQQFGDMARQEYLAVGIRLALHPMADLATEPRWARAAETFGEDAHLSAQLVHAYVKDFQGETLGPSSVATMVKHFSATDELVWGRFNPGGKLPFELPRSMQAVANQQEDVPYDTENPHFSFGHGLRYNTN